MGERRTAEMHNLRAAACRHVVDDHAPRSVGRDRVRGLVRPDERAMDDDVQHGICRFRAGGQVTTEPRSGDFDDHGLAPGLDIAIARRAPLAGLLDADRSGRAHAGARSRGWTTRAASPTR